jgi:hypothetical protein
VGDDKDNGDSIKVRVSSMGERDGIGTVSPVAEQRDHLGCNNFKFCLSVSVGHPIELNERDVFVGARVTGSKGMFGVMPAACEAELGAWWLSG